MRRGSTCTICQHPKRAEIELALANAVPCRLIARRFDVHKDAAWRHGRNHMDARLKARLKTTGMNKPVDLERLRISESEGLLQHLVSVRGRLYRALDTAEEIGNPTDVARVSQPLHKNLELTAKLLGDLRTGSTVNHLTLITAPEYHHLRTGLVQCLRPFPEAREAVLNLLQSLERVERPALEHSA